MSTPPPVADGGDPSRPVADLADVLARVLDSSDDEWSGSDGGDPWSLVAELSDLAPAVLAAALLDQVRDGRVARVEKFVEEWLSLFEEKQLVDVLRCAADLDPQTARRWAPRLLDLQGCIRALGVRTAVDVVVDELRRSLGVGADEVVGTSHDSGRWEAEARRDLWRMSPARMWEVIYHADRPTGLQHPDNLLCWALEVTGNGGYAPFALFHADPRPEGMTTADLDLLDAHVEAFIERARAAVAAGEDPGPWIRAVSRQVAGCGDPWCCRPSLFYSSLMQRGCFERHGRGPWTS